MFLNPYKSNDLAEGPDSVRIESFYFRLFCAFVIETQRFYFINTIAILFKFVWFPYIEVINTIVYKALSVFFVFSSSIWDPAGSSSFYIQWGKSINHYWYSYMRHQPEPSLVQIMACCLFGTKPLLEAMLGYG